MTWMLTATGRRVSLSEIGPADIDIADIAHHLSHLCRFTGATRQFYSVAEHSLLVCDLVRCRALHDYWLQLAALLHDAHEAYLGDISTPLKQVVGEFSAIDRAVSRAVAARFGLPATQAPEVKRADLEALAIEKRDLMPDHPEPWAVLKGIEPPDGWCAILTTPEDSRLSYLQRFQDLQYHLASAAAREAA